MPAIAKILIVFVLVLVATRFRVHLGLALVLGGLGLDLWAGSPTVAAFGHMARGMVNPDMWLFIAMTALVVEFGRFLTKPDNADVLFSAVAYWGGKHGRALSLMALPAVVGLIPMPAGALFSAPLVKQIAEDDMSHGWKSAVNYWFRHVWEYWWPLYPGVLLAMYLFGLPPWKFFLCQLPFSILTIWAGYFFLVRPHVERHRTKESAKTCDAKGMFSLLSVMFPIAAGVALMPPVLQKVMPDATEHTRSMLSMVIGLCGGVLLIVLKELRETKRTEVFKTVLKGQSLSLTAMLGGVMLFQFMLRASGLVELAAREMNTGQMPVIVMVAALPALAGVVTGISVGFIGASFPLVTAIVATDAGISPLSALVLAYGFGYMGMMFSPVHLCLLVTRDFFKSSLPAIYMQIAPAAAVVLAYSVLCHAVLRILGW